jgi:hydroxymethylbilane synthase
VGQGAVAVQCRAGDVGRFTPALDQSTARAINRERALQAALGAGCHTAFGAFVDGQTLHLYHERIGRHRLEIRDAELRFPGDAAQAILRHLQLL